MSNALGIRVVSAKEATQLLGRSTSRDCRLGISDTTLPQSRAIGRVSIARRREPTPDGRDRVASSIRTSGRPGMAQCGLLEGANP
jgi:hypothetical protein